MGAIANKNRVILNKWWTPKGGHEWFDKNNVIQEYVSIANNIQYVGDPYFLLSKEIRKYDMSVERIANKTMVIDSHSVVQNSSTNT